jgi:hypothetical protein
VADDTEPSAVARALALEMRAFDPSLGDADVAAIATRIDQGRAYAAALSPKKKRLANAVEPLTVPRAPDADA